jgi:hypothetical protein
VPVSAFSGLYPYHLLLIMKDLLPIVGKKSLRLAFQESEVAQHVPAAASHSHWIIRSLRLSRGPRVSG